MEFASIRNTIGIGIHPEREGREFASAGAQNAVPINIEQGAQAIHISGIGGPSPGESGERYFKPIIHNAIAIGVPNDDALAMIRHEHDFQVAITLDVHGDETRGSCFGHRVI